MVEWDSFDSTPTPLFSNAYFFTSAAEADAFTPIPPAGGSVQRNPNTQVPVHCWFKMDLVNLKDTLNLLSGFINIYNHSMFELMVAPDGSTGVETAFFRIDTGPGTTPRNGWKDDAGVERKPPPSEAFIKGKPKIGRITLPKDILQQILIVQAFLQANCLAAAGNKFQNAAVCRAAADVGAIAKLLAAGKISVAEAVAKVNVIVNALL